MGYSNDHRRRYGSISASALVSELTPYSVPAPEELADASHRTMSLSVVEDSNTEPLKLTRRENTERKVYPVSVLGGTFDYLHPGHKILLSMAAWITTSKLIVGVTG